MVEYTIILLYGWSKHGDNIKKMLHDNKFKWNSSKIKRLTTQELIDEYKKFKVNKEFKIEETMFGSSGIYENLNNDIVIKFIKTESIDDNDYTDNMLIIYKGIVEKFYISLIKECRDIGCLVMKVVDNEVIFKNRINVDLINKINDIQGEKNVKIRNFIEKINIIEEINGKFSDDFKSKWIECINKN